MCKLLLLLLSINLYAGMQRVDVLWDLEHDQKIAVDPAALRAMFKSQDNEGSFYSHPPLFSALKAYNGYNDEKLEQCIKESERIAEDSVWKNRLENLPDRKDFFAVMGKNFSCMPRRISFEQNEAGVLSVLCTLTVGKYTFFGKAEVYDALSPFHIYIQGNELSKLYEFQNPKAETFTEETDGEANQLNQVFSSNNFLRFPEKTSTSASVNYPPFCGVDIMPGKAPTYHKRKLPDLTPGSLKSFVKENWSFQALEERVLEVAQSEVQLQRFIEELALRLWMEESGFLLHHRMTLDKCGVMFLAEDVFPEIVAFEPRSERWMLCLPPYVTMEQKLKEGALSRIPSTFNMSAYLSRQFDSQLFVQVWIPAIGERFFRSVDVLQNFITRFKQHLPSYIRHLQDDENLSELERTEKKNYHARSQEMMEEIKRQAALSRAIEKDLDEIRLEEEQKRKEKKRAREDFCKKRALEKQQEQKHPSDCLRMIQEAKSSLKAVKKSPTASVSIREESKLLVESGWFEI
ncbi:MAG: hypothetical protein OXC30_00815 [Alphaproteobacteria bacterium]|nr:hypothetical protein [Alphaproteobacteria bacterium]